MRRPLTLSDRARGYGLWPGDVLACLPGARLEHVAWEHRDRRSLTITLALPADISPVPDMPVQVALTILDARVRVMRPTLRGRLRRRPSRPPEVVELRHGRGGRYRLLHTAGVIVAVGSAMRVDVVAAPHLSAVSDPAAAS